MDYQNDGTKIPFYMTYPMQNMYLMEMEYEKDMERMKELYPEEIRRLLPCVESFCDELEFEGSRIYDENPDKRMMEREIGRLYQRIVDGITEEEGAVGAGAVTESGEITETGESMEIADEDNTGKFTDMSGADNAGETETTTRFAGSGKFSFPVPAELLASGMDEKLQGMTLGARPPMGPGRPPVGPARPPVGPARPPMGPGRPPVGPGRPPMGPGNSCDDPLCTLAGILFWDEIYRRRCRNRRCQRWW